MIYASFKLNHNEFKQFTLTGHAESGPAGHDLVCAAASALVIGTANNLTRIADIDPALDANEEEGGFINVVLPEEVNEDQQEKAQILLKGLYYSLLDIEEEYGEFISVTKTNH